MLLTFHDPFENFYDFPQRIKKPAPTKFELTSDVLEAMLKVDQKVNDLKYDFWRNSEVAQFVIDLPGAVKNSIKVDQIESNKLRVKWDRSVDYFPNESEVKYEGITKGSFKKIFVVGCAFESSDVKVTYKDGQLFITIGLKKFKGSISVDYS